MRLPDSVPVTSLNDALFQQYDVNVDVLRLDMIDPILSGNKPFKLIHNLAQAQAQGHRRLLSFGGAWSNHLYALAEAGERAGLQTAAIIRGDDRSSPSATLEFLVAKGMQLIHVSRSDYRRRHDPDFLEHLQQQFGPFYLVPEGGANLAGVQGCEQIAGVIQRSVVEVPDEIMLACGTGATLAGVVAGLRVRALPVFVRGIAVLKGASALEDDIRSWLASAGEDCDWALETGYHWGGYARFPTPLRTFVQAFEQQHRMQLDPVYTAKVFSALYQRLQAHCYAPGSRILVIHTGGLQGRAGFALQDIYQGM